MFLYATMTVTIKLYGMTGPPPDMSVTVTVVRLMVPRKIWMRFRNCNIYTPFFYDNALKWNLQNHTDKKSTLVQWRGAVRQQFITWADVDRDLCQIVSLGHSVITLSAPMELPRQETISRAPIKPYIWELLNVCLWSRYKFCCVRVWYFSWKVIAYTQNATQNILHMKQTTPSMLDWDFKNS